MIQAGHTEEELELMQLLAGPVRITLLPDGALTQPSKEATLPG